MVDADAVSFAEMRAVIAQAAFALYLYMQVQFMEHDELTAVFHGITGQVPFQHMHQLLLMCLLLLADLS
jgi:hypothetical protein